MSSETHAPQAHGGHGITPYLVVFGALSGFTLISFVVNYIVREGALTPHAGFALILGVAVVKATLVATYFMHLNFDWRRVLFMIVPALILGTMMMLVLLPDIVLGWRQ
jgi:caa(3)-type oxidase subunit IV